MITMKLRCLQTHTRYGKYTPGNVFNVTKFYINDEMTKGVVTIEHDGMKTTDPFKFSSEKNLVTKTEAFRVLLVPYTEVK
jgi:hypothetical protein